VPRRFGTTTQCRVKNVKSTEKPPKHKEFLEKGKFFFKGGKTGCLKPLQCLFALFLAYIELVLGGFNRFLARF